MLGKLEYSAVNDKIGTLTFNNPSRRNALNAQMWAELPNILAYIEHRHKPDILILKGHGEHFSAGADISEFDTLYATQDSALKISNIIADGLKALSRLPMPVIAQIRGSCFGGGCALALTADIRVADDTARFAIPPARLGLVYPYEDLKRLINIVGLSQAQYLVMTARPIDANKARSISLIQDLVSPDTLAPHVREMADALTTLSSFSLKSMKAMFLDYQNGLPCETPQSRELFQSGFTGPDFKEGLAAFLEKRQPDF